jgi:hypothetical protein
MDCHGHRSSSEICCHLRYQDGFPKNGGVLPDSLYNSVLWVKRSLKINGEYCKVEPVQICCYSFSFDRRHPVV